MSKLGQRKIPISGATYKLARHDDGKIIYGDNIGWIGWNDDETFKELHQKPAVGLSLIIDPHRWDYTWLTTQVTDIIEQGDRYIIFQTKNSKYELTWIDK